ncbi:MULTISPECIES: hypothetical protein [unclassified Pseudomonas]|nr:MULTISPECIES: hypothetical protein [unclassified Pseudomonas]NWC92598.1 hypothetical protein [Pseudomonas sp. IPO3779]NWD15596.1 hypothetical protein [Pseudomonas sp. IPO3778]
MDIEKWKKTARLIAILCWGVFFSAIAQASNEEDIHCAAYYEVLSISGSQPDVSEQQSSLASYAFVRHIGDTPENRRVIWEKVDEFRAEISGEMTPEKIAKFRTKYDAQCRESLKIVWCEAYKTAGACVL